MVWGVRRALGALVGSPREGEDCCISRGSPFPSRSQSPEGICLGSSQVTTRQCPWKQNPRKCEAPEDRGPHELLPVRPVRSPAAAPQT